MNLNEYAAEWIKYAERDYDTVLLLMSHQRQHIEIIAFHCQQTAEKYLKDALAWTKSIRSAVRQCLGLDPESTNNPNSSNITPSPRSPV